VPSKIASKKPQKDRHQTGIAAEFYVLSQLIRNGHDAYITMGNKKSVDIHVIVGKKAYSIDVKAVRGYSSWPVSNIKKDEQHFIAYVAYKNKFDDLSSIPDVYLVPSKKVTSFSTKAGERSNKSGIENYKDNWSLSSEC